MKPAPENQRNTTAQNRAQTQGFLPGQQHYHTTKTTAHQRTKTIVKRQKTPKNKPQYMNILIIIIVLIYKY